MVLPPKSAKHTKKPPLSRFCDNYLLVSPLRLAYHPGHSASCQGRQSIYENALLPRVSTRKWRITKMEIRLAIVDDDADFLTAFCDYTEQAPGFTRPLGYQNAKAALRGLERHAFDVVLVDLILGRSSGSDLIRDIKARHPKAHIIALSGHSEKELVHQVMSNGAEGYLLKNQSLREILEDVQEFIVTGVVINPEVLKIILAGLQNAQTQDKKLDNLTKKERQILERLSVGKSYKDIADELGRSPQTIYSHSKRMYRKIDVSSKTEAVVLFMNSNRPPATTN